MTQTPVILGPYVELEQLIALRHKRTPAESSNARIVGNRAGQKLSKIKGRGVDFAEVRPYQPGDDVRTIDWRVTARKNKPHTKIFREERERPTLIVTDQTQSMFFGSVRRFKSVAAAELSARIAWQNLSVGDRVGGVVIGNQRQALHKPFRTSAAVARLLNDIVQFNQALERPESAQHGLSVTHDQASVTNGLMRVRKLTRNNYRIFVVSDFAGDLATWQEHLHALARHNQVIAIDVYDPLEAHMPPTDHYVVTDGERRLQFWSGDEALRKNYAERFEARRQNLAELCRHESMAHLSIGTDREELEMSWV